jgi:hypothetical protein
MAFIFSSIWLVLLKPRMAVDVSLVAIDQAKASWV